MSDSESDLLPSNVFTFQNENTMISAKGPSVNSTNMTNLSFHNNILTSTMHMPRNFERQRYGEPTFDQRSMYYRREASPASMYSGSDMRGRNFHQSYYNGGMGSQRSMYYGRSGSPMSMRSMRSIDSNASMSAADIALAFKNVNFNKHDLRMIKEAYNKFMKRRIRKKIEKRRNMKLFLKGYRRKSGYDSGEQGSDSSISSDDCKPTSSAMYKDNMSCRSTRTDITDFRRNIRESDLYRDRTDNFKQNAFKNMFSVTSVNARERCNAPNFMQHVPPLSQKDFAVPNTAQKPGFTQKDRFRSGYLLPSQRFNKSVASVPILEKEIQRSRDPRLQARQNTWNPRNQVNNEIENVNRHANGETDSDQEEIFSEVTIREKTMQNFENQYEKITDQGKRGLEIEDSNKCSERKRAKFSSPIKKTNKANDLLKGKNTSTVAKDNKKITKINKDCEDKNMKDPKDTEGNDNAKAGEFEFIKPQFPVRKSCPNKIKEKLISKSAQPIADIIPPTKPQVPKVPEPVSTDTAPKSPSTTTENQPDASDASRHSNSDQSMRPSFIKRKLFTQKMDVTEKKNLSNGAININSPQTNVYSAIQKEKHRARKLVTNQSCLSRDIAQEGNNLLDLIHKIVPPDRMNMTNVTNKTSVICSVSNKNHVNDDDKWDVTSLISTCNNDDVSDTYTDEEIFGADDTKRKVDNNVKKRDSVNKPKENDKSNKNVQKPKDTKKSNNVVSKPSSEIRILVEKLPPNILASQPTVEVSKAVPIQGNDYNKKNIYNCVKSFWDTDFESDMESPAPKRAMLTSQAVKENQNQSNFIPEPKIPKNKKSLNISLGSVSESIKSRTMPTNNLSKLKFNISKTHCIKSFLTPKNVKTKATKAKDIQEDNEISILDDNNKHSVKEPIKKASKVNQNSKSAKKGNSDSKKSESKNDNSDNKKVETKNTNKKRNGHVLETPSKTKQPQQKTKEAKKPAKKEDAKPTNRSISGTRSVRTPKRKACCEEPDDDHNKSAKSSATKSGSKQKEKASNANKKPKLANSPQNINGNNTKGKILNKVNDGVNQKTSTKQPADKMNSTIVKTSKQVKSNKNIELVTEPMNVEVPTLNRTLRSRRIDLSSSINSSTENVTLQIRNLRTRRVDLSNSLRNSSLDETLNKGPRKTADKKPPANLNRTAIIKQARSAENQTKR